MKLKKRQKELLKEEIERGDIIVEDTPEEEENWDYDFSAYEEEENQQDKQSQNIKEKPAITGLRSKYSPSMMQLESLEAIRTKISMYGINVSSRSQDINELWSLYGCLNEYWARIHDIFGSQLNTEVKNLQVECYTLLLEAEQESVIDYSVHLKLLDLRNMIYIIAQRNNLGLEVEKSSFSHFDKAKKGITQ